MFDFFNTCFIMVFSYIYPWIHSHLVSYILILALGLLLAWSIWKSLRSMGRGRGFFSFLTWLLLWVFQIFLIAFLLWFVFFYFHTFQDFGR